MKVSRNNWISIFSDLKSLSLNAPYFQVRTPLSLHFTQGEINLKGVNVKPDKASMLLQGLGIPFQLKAGTIGNLQIKLNYFQMFKKSSAPMEIVINDLFVIVGSNMMQRSNDDSFFSHTEDLIAPYNEQNMFHIMNNTLTVRR